MKLKVFGVGEDAALENKAAHEGGHALRTGYRMETTTEQPDRFLVRAKPPSIQTNLTQGKLPQKRGANCREKHSPRPLLTLYFSICQICCVLKCCVPLPAASSHLWPHGKVRDITSKPAALGTPAIPLLRLNDH